MPGVAREILETSKENLNFEEFLFLAHVTPRAPMGFLKKISANLIQPFSQHS